MALDLTANGVKSLIKSFLAADQSSIANSDFAQEVRFANPHNLAAMIKWSLARLSRFYTVPVPSSMAVKRTVEIQEEVAVVQQRGCLDSESYVQWKEAERGKMTKASRKFAKHVTDSVLLLSSSQRQATHGRGSPCSATASTLKRVHYYALSSLFSPRRSRTATRMA